MMQQSEPSDNLLQFVEKQAGLWRKHTLTLSTKIERDLGVTGIDADEFMEAFFREFDVASGDYDGGRYFGPEGLEVGLSCIGRWLDRRRGVKRFPKEELTLGMLQHAIDLGVWDSERLKEEADTQSDRPNEDTD
ncbi:DUF1493 family protein [Paraburkholderia sp. Ac-20336]|uniref:DUF1493 family protein n=1 Tax=Paraburkholderia sp. Ac-20336 TaxID=2703886 RepID=UPI001F122305|nr:DUF1493 family protein [Paraburkholderia sp. Ac-20336]